MLKNSEFNNIKMYVCESKTKLIDQAMTEKQFKIYTKVGIIAFIICSVFFVFQVNKVVFDYDFEKFFPYDYI